MRDRRLRVVLWIAGVGWGISIFGVVVPWSWFEGWAAMWGVGALPPTPYLVYAARLMSAVSAFVGVYFLILATNPTAYAPFLNLGIAGLMFFGLVAVVGGLALNIRPPWYLGDGLFCWIIGVLLLIWRPRLQATPQPPAN